MYQTAGPPTVIEDSLFTNETTVMTSPIASYLGEPITVQVTATAQQICPKMKGPVLVYNNDLTNIAYIGYGTSGVGVTNSVPVQPLASVTIPGDKSLWGWCPTASVSLTVVPGGLALSPSPAQIAAQISLSGVGLLNNNKLLSLVAFPSVNVVPGTPLVTLIGSATNPITGTGYVGSIGISASVSSFASVDFQWSDAATGQQLQEQTWWILPGTVANNHVFRIQGPTNGSQLTVTVTAFTGTVTYFHSIFQNSLSYNRHDWRSDMWSASPVAGLIQFTEEPTLMVFQLPSVSFAAGVTNTYLLPLFAGRVRFFGQTSSGVNDMRVALNTLADQTVVGNNPVWKGVADSTGTINQEFSLPRIQCDFTITNANAAAKNLEAALIAEEY